MSILGLIAACGGRGGALVTFDLGRGCDGSTVSLGDGAVDLAIPPRPCAFVQFGFRDYPVASNPVSVVAADFNGDGKLDVAAGGSGLSVLMNMGDGTFAAAQTTHCSFGIHSMVAGDFNGDGRPDLALVVGGDSVRVLAGLGDGTFSCVQVYPAGPDTDSIAASDLDGDGRLDLAVTNHSWSSVSVLLNNGAGFAAPVSYQAGGSTSLVVASDFSGDGKPDLAVAAGGGLSVLLNRGDGTFADAQFARPAGSGSNIFVAADLDGDHKADLALAGVSVLLSHGDGTFAGPAAYRATFSRSVVAADFNGDGMPDIAGLAEEGRDVFVFPGRGDGTLDAADRSSVATTFEALYIFFAAADLDGDGRPDLLAADFGTSKVGVLLNTCQP